MAIMLKKKFIVSLSTLAILAVPFSAFAATSASTTAQSVKDFFGIDASKLTDTQKADMKSYSGKFASLEKEYINQMVSDGSMTKDEGDAALKLIDERVSSGNDYAFIPGFGGGMKGHGEGGKFGPEGAKGHGEFAGVSGLDITKLTDAQKADVVDSLVKIATQEKENLASLVSNQIMTQDEATSMSTNIDERITSLQTNGLTQDASKNKPEDRKSATKGAMKEHKEPKTLTDAQKAIFTDNEKKINDLRKELITKLVSDGTLTADQGTAATTAIDNAKNHHGKNFKDHKSKDVDTTSNSTTTNSPATNSTAQ
jgi:polyhydroxyalkanoate synthesis regulator phasin